MSALDLAALTARVAEDPHLAEIAADAGMDPEWLAEAMVAVIGPLVGEAIARRIDERADNPLLKALMAVSATATDAAAWAAAVARGEE